MNPEDLDLTSVNWEFGMLLTPAHFLRQERYHEAGLLWMLRHAMADAGLVGGGPRVPESERGAAKFDPVFSLNEDETGLAITVTQCRGITAGGGIVDVSPERPVMRKFSRGELEGISEANLYIGAQPFTKQVLDSGADDFNPELHPFRGHAYTLNLGPSADSSTHAVCVGRVRRQRHAAGVERDTSFIPACTTMCAHSELTARWREIVEAITLLTDRYTELFRAMREFLTLAVERGIETSSDAGAAMFVENMLTLLQSAIFDLLDPVQPPQQFFGKLRKLFYCAAVRFDLTPAVQQYFDTLKQAGETEFTALIQRQRSLLAATRTWGVGENLAVEVRSALAAISALQRLERAMEGKYLDFRVSPSLDAMNFIFDRGGKALYRLAAKASHVQGVAEDLRVYFSQLRLEGRDKYRLILVSDPEAHIEKGDKMTVEIRINEGAGYARPPLNLSSIATGPEQRNFEFDFDAPDVTVISDLVVAMPAEQQIRTALLFIRHRFYAERSSDAAPKAEPVRPDDLRSMPPRSAERDRSAPWDGSNAAKQPREQRPRDWNEPWDSSRSPEPAPERGEAPPRRRRLE